MSLWRLIYDLSLRITSVFEFRRGLRTKEIICLFGKPMRSLGEFRAEVGIKPFDALFHCQSWKETLRRPCNSFKTLFRNSKDSAVL